MLESQSSKIWMDRLMDLSETKEIWIWGSGNQGRGIAQSLTTLGLSPRGFIDASVDQQKLLVLGKRVLSPDKFFNGENTERFAIIASYFFEKDIVETCIKNELKEGDDFISYKNLKPYDYAVEVSGKCNLHCISCPRGNGKADRSSSGFMSLADFKKVLDKIILESPFVGNIQLYQWGEPLLNPDLPQMIQYANARGIKCAISSNLNLKKDYEALIRSKPEWLRISCSGCGDNYEQTHTGGKWTVFKDNLIMISQWRKAYHPSMKIELFYHVYQHNNGNDLKVIQKLCDTYNIEFHPVNAYLIGLDDVLQHLEGEPLPAATARAEKMLCVRLDEGVRLAQCEINKPCPSLRCLLINSDLRVSNCMMYYYRDNNVAAENYLKMSLEEIEKKRQDCGLCRRCRSQALHRYCHVYWHTPVEKGAA